MGVYGDLITVYPNILRGTISKGGQIKYMASFIGRHIPEPSGIAAKVQGRVALVP